jgi:ribulose kinase
VHEHLTELGVAAPVGSHGLIALDWLSGNRSVLVDHRLSGLIIGLTRSTTPEQVYVSRRQDVDHPGQHDDEHRCGDDRL